MIGRQYRYRLLLMAPGALALVAALWGGVARLGLELPALPIALPATHGPLLAAGFLGTLIGLERAVALGRLWTYIAPLLTGLGALAYMLGLNALGRVLSGPVLMTLGSLGMVAAFVVILRLRWALFTATMALGALSLLIGNILWLTGWPLPLVSLWWGGFLVLTIAGERLDLSRVTGLSSVGQASFVLVVTLFLFGLIGAGANFDVGMRLAGASLIGLALWLANYDVARWTVRHPGLPRFIAVCLLSGYVWLGIGGLLALLFGGVEAGPRYDAVLHSLFLGFVLTMIFGHAPIILPAVFGWTVSFRPAFYAHLVLLHPTLLLRVAADLADWPVGRQWGGLLNIAALLVFAANTIYAVLKSPKTTRPVSPNQAEGD